MKARIEKRRFTRGWFKPYVTADVVVLVPESKDEFFELVRTFNCDAGMQFNKRTFSTGEVHLGVVEGSNYSEFFLCPNVSELEKIAEGNPP